MEKELPKIDLPEDWVIGTGISRELLSLYTDYPVRLRCEMFVLCLDGEVEASVNLNHISVHANDFITLVPGTIFQIHQVKGNLQIYFLGFSSQYIQHSDQAHSLLETIIFTLGRPVISLKSEGARMLEQYLCFLIRMYEHFPEKYRKEISPNLYADVHKGIAIMYKSRSAEKLSVTKSEQLCRNFTQLVLQHYTQTREVAWYAQQLGITHAYLSLIVKQVTGRTCGEIISAMVIMDAKSQLKSTHLSVQDISDSLNFANVSFFGKYFKRYVGMSPMEYRNNG